MSPEFWFYYVTIVILSAFGAGFLGMLLSKLEDN
jgi:hypothetical protein